MIQEKSREKGDKCRRAGRREEEMTQQNSLELYGITAHLLLPEVETMLGIGGGNSESKLKINKDTPMPERREGLCRVQLKADPLFKRIHKFSFHPK